MQELKEAKEKIKERDKTEKERGSEGGTGGETKMKEREEETKRINGGHAICNGGNKNID